MNLVHVAVVVRHLPPLAKPGYGAKEKSFFFEMFADPLAHQRFWVKGVPKGVISRAPPALEHAPAMSGYKRFGHNPRDGVPVSVQLSP